MSKVSQERAEIKKEAIRKEIWDFMCRCVDEKVTPENTSRAINAHIEGMKRRNPQENHLVTSVCLEVKRDVDAFCKRMIEKYGAETTAGEKK